MVKSLSKNFLKKVKEFVSTVSRSGMLTSTHENFRALTTAYERGGIPKALEKGFKKLASYIHSLEINLPH